MTPSARPKVAVAWSSGKDAALTLHRLRSGGEYEVAGLLTTVSSAYGRVAMHGVRTSLLDRQAAALGLPLTRVEIPTPCSNAEYDARMALAVRSLRAEGVGHLAFGDLFLEEVRAYREERLASTGITPVFPLWGADTRALAEEMLRLGIEAHVVCLDPRVLPRSFAGRRFDRAFLEDLPPGVDPCGERGEFHTFVSAGPMFARPIAVRRGEVVERDGFVFADLLLREEPPPG